MVKKVYLAFDIDGTIYDAGNILEDAFREAVNSCMKEGIADNFQAPSRADITATLGYPLEKICLILFPELNKTARDYLSDRWTKNLVSQIRDKNGELIDGVDENVKKLADMGCGMLVASNGAREYVEAILETYDLMRYFSEPFTYAEGHFRNKTDIVSHYLKVVDDSKIIMIGDRATDLDAAKSNGIPFIGCAFGHAGSDEISGEKYIVSHFSEIPGVVQQIIDLGL